MKVSRTWLQTYFDAPLPPLAEIADALTFHAFEIEDIEGEQMEVNVLPDRAAYALCHRGIATEVAAVLTLPLKDDPLREGIPEWQPTTELSIQIEDTILCPRYIGALVRGAQVGPSPAWLREALESVGQRSVNNVVDATNYVMLNIGQPLHAFDAGKLDRKDGSLAIQVRRARDAEEITTLTGDDYVLPAGTLLITDAHAERPIGIAGVKGGAVAAVTEATTELVIESASFDGTAVRRAAQSLKLFTDASLRFQNKLSAQLPGYGMRDVLALIQQVAGGEVVGVVEAVHEGLLQERLMPVSVSLERVNAILGSTFEDHEVANVFDRLGIPFMEESGTYSVTPPFWRSDLQIPEDLVEEVGRILGYDRVLPAELPPRTTPPDQRVSRALERIRDFLTERGFSEISSPSFAATGEILLANPLQSDRPFLRASLLENMHDALVRGVQAAPRVTGVAPLVKLFELGNVFTKDGEKLQLALGSVPVAGKFSDAILKENVATLQQELFATPCTASYSLNGDRVEIDLAQIDLEKLGMVEGVLYQPREVTNGMYRAVSAYPFALRDIAVWTPEGTEESEVSLLIEQEANSTAAGATGLLARIDLFDRFLKDGRISYAFRLVFESPERTLSDKDLDPVMAKVSAALNTREGWQVR